jgi:hypothetical protein
MADMDSQPEENTGIVPHKPEQLVSFGKPVEIARSTREALMNLKTDRNYIKAKFGGHVYIVNTYMDDTFKKYYPIHHMEIVSGPDIILGYWVTFTVKIKAYLTPSIYISELGTAGARLQIPEQMSKAIKSGQMNISQVTPLDFIDMGNDCKSALTKAIANCQSRFGVGADVYNKGIISEEVRKAVDLAVEEVISKYIVLPAEQIRARTYYSDLKVKNGNVVAFLDGLREKYNVFDEEQPTN